MASALDKNEKHKEKISESALKEIISDKLEEKGSGGIFVWSMFLLCALPNILNGFHVASYTLLGHLPDDQWCSVDALQQSNWTEEQQRSITQKGLTTKGCTVLDWDYRAISGLSYDEALNYTQEMSRIKEPNEVDCKARGQYGFKNPESTFVTDWELICDRSLQRTSAQVFLSLGKFFGSFSFGIFADKYGRKSSFTLGAAFFLVSSFLCTFSPFYTLFLVGRFGLGAASSGLFYPAFTMIVENICLKHRSYMSIAFSASYPIGMIILAALAYWIHPWRYLQLALTLPALLLILDCYLMHESPRWLIMKHHYRRAYKILFKSDCYYEIEKSANIDIELSTDKTAASEKRVSLWHKIKEGPLKQFIALFATWRLRRLILTSYFMFCVTSLSYYVTALNASNLAVSRYLYVAATGIVDLPSYVLPIIMLRYTGRRVTTVSFFLLTGIALMLVLAVPADETTWIVTFAMLGRFGISGTYSVVTLYTAELYPTEVRNSALGTCSTFAHIGSISAPYVVDILGELGWYLPTTICGISVLIAAILTLGLPETAVEKLADCVDEEKESNDLELKKDFKNGITPAIDNSITKENNTTTATTIIKTK